MIDFHEHQEDKIREILNFLKHKYEIHRDCELLDQIKKIDQLNNSKLHLSFMFSSPLVIKTMNKDRNLQV